MLKTKVPDWKAALAAVAAKERRFRGGKRGGRVAAKSPRAKIWLPGTRP